MFRKTKYLIIFTLFISILICGFIRVSSELVNTVKDKSYMKVYFTAKPFDLTIDVGNYLVYANEKAFNNIKNSAVQVFENITSINPFKNGHQ